jgi:hypothetical protein
MRIKKNTFYEDKYASVSVVESVPCVKVKLSGFPQGSDHYQFVQSKLLETIRNQISNYCRLHLLTDSTEAGLVLDEDMTYFKTTIIPAMEDAGIRYHAIVLPQNFCARWIRSQTALTTSRKLKVEYFESVLSAFKWLKKR